jgi:hypothetical protein
MNEIINIKMLDPRLQKMLNAYGVTPERNPEAARHTRERFISELDKIFVEPIAPKSAVGWLNTTSWISNLYHLTSGLTSFIGKRAILYIFITLFVFSVFLFSGVGITVYAASSSLPGDIAYPLKTTFETTRASLTVDSAVRSRLYLDYAGRRLTEIQSLIDQRRYTDIAQAEDEFERDVRSALNVVENLSQSDPAQAATLNSEVVTVLRTYSDILTQMLTSAPADIQPILQNAIDALQSAISDDDDNSAGGSSDDGGVGGREGGGGGQDDDSTGGSGGDDAGAGGGGDDGGAGGNEGDDGGNGGGQDDDSTGGSGDDGDGASGNDGDGGSGGGQDDDSSGGSGGDDDGAGDSGDDGGNGSGDSMLPASTANSSPSSVEFLGDDVICEGSLGAVTVVNLLVPQNASCFLNGTMVEGTIMVESNATLTAQLVTVNGNVQAIGASNVEVLAGSTVGGSIQIKEGGAAQISGVSVNGDIQFESNNGGLSATSNQVVGNIQVFKNKSGITIADNSLNGNLQCKENDILPDGGNNVVHGNKEDQCAAL